MALHPRRFRVSIVSRSGSSARGIRRQRSRLRQGSRHAGDEAFAFWDYGVELSRRFRALKIWLTLRYYGTRRIADAISEDISLGAYMRQRIQEAEDLELLAPGELSICCFRYVPHELRAKLNGASGD